MDVKIKDFVRARFEEMKNLDSRERNKEIIRKVKIKFNTVINWKEIYDICQRIDTLKKKIKDINDSVKENKKYEVVDWHYIFHRKDEAPFRFSVEEIDMMFLDFSSKWNNLTGEEMLQKYELKPEAWQIIKNRLRLYKASNVISPYTAENSTEEELEEKIEYATARHIDTIKGKMVTTHEKKFKEDAKKAFKMLGNIDYFLDNLREYITEHKPIEIDYVRKPQLNNDRFDLSFSDIHIGKENTSAIVNRFDDIYNYIINRPESNVNIICLGDLGESFAPGWMHPWQVENMEMHGFELIMFIVNIFEKFLIWLDKAWKNVTFKWIWWNHDRFGQNNNQDTQRTAALCIYEMIKRWLSNTEVEIDYFIEKINSFQIWNLHYIIHHGDNNFDKKKQEDILWKNGNNQLYNVILHGDKHSWKFQETKWATMIQVPMLAGKGEYDTMLDLHSEPWFVVIEENRFKTADISFKRLK